MNLTDNILLTGVTGRFWKVRQAVGVPWVPTVGSQGHLVLDVLSRVNKALEQE